MNKVSKSRSGTSCCVVGCKTTYANSEGVQFYRFPSGRWHLPRRNRWIQAVKRINPDKSPWEPSPHTRICSRHFIGGKKHDDPDSPAYIPTINLGKKQSHISSSRSRDCLDRYARKKKREARQILKVDVIPDQRADDRKCHIGSQTDYTEVANVLMMYMFCAMQDNCAETQICMPPRSKSVEIQVGQVPPKFANATTNTAQHGPCFTGFTSITDTESCQDLSGVTLDVFSHLVRYIPVSTQKMSLSRENKILLFLMKMKLGLTYVTLGKLFCVHRTTASNSFREILCTLYEKTKAAIYWPDKLTIQSRMPKCFKLHYPKCTAIIDCTEIFCERPSTVSQRVEMFSTCKSNFALKYLIGIAPCGSISFISSGYGGGATDSYITVDSGILRFIKPGDHIIADKRFPQILSTLQENGAVVIMPPFAHRNGENFTVEECEDTRNIASVRIHVERAIQRFKLYGILKHISNDLIRDADKIVVMAGVLTNLQLPFIKYVSGS